MTQNKLRNSAHSSEKQAYLIKKNMTAHNLIMKLQIDNMNYDMELTGLQKKYGKWKRKHHSAPKPKLFKRILLFLISLYKKPIGFIKKLFKLKAKKKQIISSEKQITIKI